VRAFSEFFSDSILTIAIVVPIFDEMFDIAKLYISASTNSVQLVPLHPIIISILFHHYEELMECSKEVQEMIYGPNQTNTTSTAS